MVIWFLQLDNFIVKVCSLLESVKQHDATYMLISSMELLKCAVTLNCLMLISILWSFLSVQSMITPDQHGYCIKNWHEEQAALSLWKTGY